MMQSLKEIRAAIHEIGYGRQLVCVMIGNWTVWPLAWLVQEVKERVGLI